MGDGDPFGDVIPVEQWPTGFMDDDEFEAKFQAWLATHGPVRDDSPDPFDW